MERTERWYAVNTQPSAETKASLNLGRQGWPIFNPCIMRTIRSGRRVRTEPRPLFPGYTFVSLDITRDAWRSVNGTYGVRKLVECGGMPSPVPNPLIVALMEMVEANGCVSFASKLVKGSKVQFLSGPFYGMIGSLEHLDGQGRIRVLLSLFGRETQIKARAVDVRPT